MLKPIDIGDLLDRLEKRYSQGLGKRLVDIVLIGAGVYVFSFLMERPFDQWVVPVFSYVETRYGDAAYLVVIELILYGIVAVALGIAIVLLSEWWKGRKATNTTNTTTTKEYPLDED